MSKKKMSFRQRRAWTGRLFILPWFIGILLFFAVPLMKSIWYSFQDMNFGNGGHLELDFIGLDNFVYAFTKDPDFVTVLMQTVGNIVYQVPVIILFSLFVAIILNQEFHGRVLARAIFFLPVIVTSGVIISILNQDSYSNMISQGNASSAFMFQSSGLQQMMIDNKVPEAIVNYMTNIINNIFNLTWKSGVQILLFLAGLKTISPQLYEAAKVEGATGWESFWKITFPMISPMILANTIYTIIDSFTDYSNYIIQMINNAAFQQLRYGYSSAIAWIYFIVVLVILGIVSLLIGRKVFYQSN